MPPKDEVRAVFKSRNRTVDEQEFERSFQDIAGVSAYYEFSESHAAETLCKFAIWVAPAAVYAGKRTFDIVLEQVQKWLDKRDTVDQVELYGPDGEVVKVVKKKRLD